MTRLRPLLLCCTLIAGAVSASDPVPPATIATLKGRHVAVKPDQPEGQGSQQARDNYQAFLDLDRGDPALRAEAMRRLGDLKLEAGEYERIEADLAQGSPLATSDAIALYTRLTAAYPDYERNDAVLYQLARAYEADQQGERALATLDELVGRYPHSRYFAEAQFRRGEELFITRRWSQAEAAYAAVVALGARSEFYEQSLYKLGWSLFKRGDTDAALDTFSRLLDLKLVDDTGRVRELDEFTRPQRELLEDTLRVCAISFSFEDGASGVERFLSRQGGKPYAHLLYATLGDLYVSKQRYVDGANAYRAFVKRDPNHDSAPLLELQAINAYKLGGFASLVLSGKREFVEQYRLGSGFWANRQSTDAPVVVRELKTNVEDLAAYYHEQAQATKAPSDYEEAARWYREFLRSFPDDPAAAATNYLLADTLFESRQFRDAALEYEHTAYDYPANPKSATAAYAALVSYDREESSLAGDARAAWHRQSIDSGIHFATTFTEHPESAAVLVRTARELYDLGEFPRAVEVAGLALARTPPVGADFQRTAWLIVGNGQFEAGAFDKAEGAYQMVIALMAPADPGRAAVEERLAASVYKQAEAQQAAGNDTGAIDDFLRVAALAPGASIRSKAEFDGAALLLARKDWPRAIGVLEALRRDFPNSELQPEVTRRLAAAYVEAGRPGSAAVEFERMANAPGNPPDVQREALAQAANLYEQAGDVQNAVVSLDAYVRRFPAPYADALEARQKLADIAGRQANAPRRAALLADIVRADRAAGAERTDRSRLLAARASLELARPLRDEFNGVRLVLPVKKSLEAKRNALQRALQAYQAADAYSIAEVSTAATYEMAELYRHLGADLLASERPRALQGEELEQYGLLLEEQAYPFEEKAIEIHGVNAARAAQGVYDDSVRKSFAELATLKPARYGKHEAHAALATDLPPGVASAAVAARFRTAVDAAGAADPGPAVPALADLMTELPAAAAPALDRGIVSARLGQWQEAAEALAEAAHRDPTLGAAAVELGVVYRELGRFDDAEQSYRHALELDPNDALAHRNLGVLLDLYRDRPADAFTEFEAARALPDGDDKLLANWMAEIKPRLGMTPTATASEAP